MMGKERVNGGRKKASGRMVGKRRGRDLVAGETLEGRLGREKNIGVAEHNWAWGPGDAGREREAVLCREEHPQLA